MPKGLRVRLDPIPRPSGSGHPRNVVTGVSVALERRGGGTTLAEPDSPKPAKLVFHTRAFHHARTESTTAEIHRLAELEGKIALGTGRSPTFTGGSPPSTFVYEDPELASANEPEPAEPADPVEVPPEDDSTNVPRKLDVVFDEGTFQGMLDPDGKNARLMLPASLNDFRFVELLADLEVSESVEGSKDDNDALDIMITADAPAAAPRYAVRFIDEVGEPIDGAVFALEFGKRRANVTTGADGTAGVLATGKEPAKATLTNAADVRAKLKERWNEPREKPLFEPGEDAVLITPPDLEETLSLEPGGPLLVCVRPKVARARLRGSFFDTNHSFIPIAAKDSVDQLGPLLEQDPKAVLLVVGHTDTAGDPSFNDPLSLERAQVAEALLKRDVDVWLGRYDSGVPEKRRWGSAEDRQMIESMKDFDTKPEDEDDVRFFQRTRGLKEDGKAGKETRTQLITEYLDLFEAKLPDGMESVVHGCGENFPVDDTGDALDPNAEDGKADPGDRRVEFFLFDPEFGVQPPPPGDNSAKDSPEYPEWHRRADGLLELTLTTRSVQFFVLDDRHQLMKGVDYELRVGPVVRKRKTNEEGILREFGLPITETAELRWSLEVPPLEPDPLREMPEAAQLRPKEFRFFSRVRFDFQENVTNDLRLRSEARIRLDNLGYGSGILKRDMSTYQHDYQKESSDKLDRTGFDDLDKTHKNGLEAPPAELSPFGPDDDPENFEDDGDVLFPLTLIAHDEQGKALGGARFVVAASDGKRHEGRLDEDGRAFVSGLPPGDHAVIFPDFDGGALSVLETGDG